MAASEGASDEEDDSYFTIPISREFSDGDTSTWPVGPEFGFPDDTKYRERLARLWLEETGAYEEGTNCIIDQLPEGFALIDRPRGNNPAIRDKFVWGHPCGQYYYSSVAFFPHFYWLMKGGVGKCPCVHCVKPKKRREKPYLAPTAGGRVGRPGHPPGSVPAPGRGRGRGRGRGGTGRPPGRPPGQPFVRQILDAEGTPDVYRMAIKKLKDQGHIDQAIMETENMDWRAERTQLQQFLASLTVQASFVPRPGEIVLWLPSLEGDLAWNPQVDRVQVLSPDDRWLGDPDWRAGVVGQVPEEEVKLKDLIEATDKTWAVNYSGFRIETLPDPNRDDKSYSLHYKYVPLKCIRPFNAFELFCQGLPELHPSIQNALTVMSSFSLLYKYHIKGAWPNASIDCNAIFIGAELLVAGDAVKLKPRDYSPKHHQNEHCAVDVMVIDKIRLDLTQCDDGVGSEQLAEKYAVRLRGKVFTTAKSRAFQDNYPQQPSSPRPLTHDEVVSAFQYVGMEGYGPWYRAHPPNTSVEVSQDLIVGRCYEPDAMHLLFGSNSLALDLHGVVTARAYSRHADERIAAGRHWFWGDYRTETLGLHTLNGEDVSHYSEIRDPKMWRANLKVMDGTASLADVREARLLHERGRPPLGGKPSSAFEAMRKTSTLVSTGLGATDVSNQESSAEENNGTTDAYDEEDDAFDGGDEREEEADHEAREGERGDVEEGEEVAEEEEEDFSKPLPYIRGGTEETEMGDYVPEDEEEREPAPKRSMSL